MQIPFQGRQVPPTPTFMLADTTINDGHDDLQGARCFTGSMPMLTPEDIKTCGSTKALKPTTI